MGSLAALASVLLAAGTAVGTAACSSAETSSPGNEPAVESAGHEDDDGHEELGSSSAALVATDPVSAAVLQSCTTASVKGLATQLVEEIQCMKPGTMSRIDDIPNARLGSAVFPFLQTPARNALAAAVAARGVPISINSSLRTLPQQYMLYRWYQTRRCGIGLAASPGTSNHEGAVAVDINDYASWRTTMESKGFRWLGAKDEVHFDYVAGGINLRGISVQAFQRLWNRNHPEDLIAEDGAYGAMTEARLARSPSGGFAKGACKAEVDAGPKPPPAKTDASVGSDAGSDGGTDVPEPTLPDPPADVPIVPDAHEPPSDQPIDGESPPAESGCSAQASSLRAASPADRLALLGVGLGAFLWNARRRRRASR